MSAAQAGKVQAWADWAPCVPGCPGWAVFHCEGPGHDAELEIQRCDDCGRFERDDDAEAYVLALVEEIGASMIEAVAFTLRKQREAKS